MKKTIIFLALSISLSGCTTTNNYFIEKTETNNKTLINKEETNKNYIIDQKNIFLEKKENYKETDKEYKILMYKKNNNSKSKYLSSFYIMSENEYEKSNLIVSDKEFKEIKTKKNSSSYYFSQKSEKNTMVNNFIKIDDLEGKRYLSLISYEFNKEMKASKIRDYKIDLNEDSSYVVIKDNLIERKKEEQIILKIEEVKK